MGKGPTKCKAKTISKDFSFTIKDKEEKVFCPYTLTPALRGVKVDVILGGAVVALQP